MSDMDGMGRCYPPTDSAAPKENAGDTMRAAGCSVAPAKCEYPFCKCHEGPTAAAPSAPAVEQSNGEPDAMCTWHGGYYSSNLRLKCPQCNPPAAAPAPAKGEAERLAAELALMLSDHKHHVQTRYNIGSFIVDNEAAIMAALTRPSVPEEPTDDMVSVCLQRFRKEMDIRMDPKHPSGSPGHESMRIALRAALDAGGR